MGNCLKREFSSTVWAENDWCSINSGHDDEQFDEDGIHDGYNPRSNTEGHKLIDDMQEMLTSTSSSSLSSHYAIRELKIRISKRKLEQLLGSAERLGLTAEQLINRLMHAKTRHERKHQPSWCPNLQSIPEMN